jgi:NDP-sugar pyrophosphorylase family protein
MDAVIPASGRGSRLGELTADRPKGLVNVAGRPLLAHVFETTIEAGADELVVIVGYEVATVRMGERVNVNTSDDVEQASELVRGESKTSS